jgi:Ferritin-like domain
VNRRDLLIAGAAVAAAGRPDLALAAQSEAGILASLITREDAAAFAHGKASGPLSSRIGRDEAAHAKALRTHLAAIGTRGPEPPLNVRALDPAARRLAEADRAAAPGRAIALEESLLETYDEALLGLAEPSMLRTAASIAASHAQHLAVLRRDAGLDPLA